MNASDARAMSQYALNNIRDTLMYGLKYGSYTTLKSTIDLVNKDIKPMTTYSLIIHFGYIRQAILGLKIDAQCGNIDPIKQQHTARALDKERVFRDIRVMETLAGVCSTMIDSLQKG
jgi:hypothetical protein